MAETTKVKQIAGHTYEVTAMMGWTSLDMLGRLGKFMAAPLLRAISRGEEGLMELDIESLAPAIAMAFQALPPGELPAISKELLWATKRDGVQMPPASADVIFQARVFELLQLLLFALEVNYADFFDVARAALAEKAARSGDTTTSAGPAGA